MSKIRFVDLYCGAGLGARGAFDAGATPVLSVDAWELATKTYQANFPDSKVINTRVEANEALAATKKLKDVDVLLTSPECTSHSIARGSREGCELSRETAINILPWVEKLKPRWVVVENVARMRQWKRHDELKNGLESHGYAVSEVLLNAAELGAPQARKRLFLVCDREGTPPKQNDFEKYKCNFKPASSIVDWSGSWKCNPLFSKERAIKTIERAERAIDVLGRNEPFIIVYYGSDYAGGWQTLDAPLRTITTLDRFALVTIENGKHMMRMLQPPELLRAMGAGAHLLPFGTRRDKVKLCGNGVCATAMKAVFAEIASIQSADKSLRKADRKA